MNIFEFGDYQELLKSQIKENSEKRGYLTLLAKEVGCQKSYLSQVIRGQVHFTPEHAMKLALFWNLSESESEYLIQLVHLGRTSFPPLVKKITNRLSEIKTSQANLEQRFRSNSFQDVEAQALYYSNWMTSAIHILVDIEAFRKIESIGQRLNLSFQLVRSQLEKLERLNLVKRQGLDWLPSGKGMHLPKRSLLTGANHQNWRSRAIMDSQLEESDGVHYTAIQSLSLTDFEEVKALILKLIDRQRNLVGPSKAEELACLTCDWFRV